MERNEEGQDEEEVEAEVEVHSHGAVSKRGSPPLPSPVPSSAVRERTASQLPYTYTMFWIGVCTGKLELIR